LALQFVLLVAGALFQTDGRDNVKKLLIFALALGAIYAGVTLSRRARPSTGQPDIDQWEGEGGAVPVEADRTAQQTRPFHPAAN
jgi:hypothetical protein